MNQALVHMTDEQYENDRTSPSRPNPELVMFTKYTERFYSEREIGQIAWSAAKCLNLPECTGLPEAWDVSDWPLAVKKSIMNMAYRCYEPAGLLDESTPAWDEEETDEAEELFDEYPELRLAFADVNKARDALTGHTAAK